MAVFIGVGLALAVAIFARVVGLDRDRGFYATVLVVVASYYGLFAAMGGDSRAILLESIVIIGFLVISALGFRMSQWILVGGLIAHGVFDFFHGHVISNPGVPSWWPNFCMTFDVTVGLYLAWLIVTRGAPKGAT